MTLYITSLPCFLGVLYNWVMQDLYHQLEDPLKTIPDMISPFYFRIATVAGLSGIFSQPQEVQLERHYGNTAPKNIHRMVLET